MSYELVEEVLDHAPAGLGAAERLVLVCIAEECRGKTRIRDIPAEDIRRRTGLGERGLRHACERLAKAGIKVRVALSLDRNGEPVYALTGKVCRWVLPAFPAPAGCPCTRCSEADLDVLPQSEEDAQGRAPDAQGRAPDVTGTPAGPTGPPKPSIEFPFEGTVDRGTALSHARAAIAASSKLGIHARGAG